MKSEIVSCHDISFSYGKRKLFSNLSLEIHPLQFWVISGDSGIGKSTFLKILTGQLKPQMGHVAKPAAWSEIPQDLGLCEGLRAIETIASGSLKKYSSWKTLFGLPTSENLNAKHWGKLLGVDAVLQNEISLLSGGEKQRVAMARALMSDAKLFIVDEPISMLDENRATEALLILKNEVYSRGGSLVCVLHQSKLISNFATHELALSSQNENGWHINA